MIRRLGNNSFDMTHAVVGDRIVLSASAAQIVELGQYPERAPPCAHLGEPTGETFPPAEGLGDYIEDALSALGITKARWAEIVAKFRNLPANEGGGCGGCGWRQKFLNKASEWLGCGEGRGPELNRLVQVTDLPTMPLRRCACERHPRCVEHFRPDDKLRAAMLADLRVAACEGCPDYAPRGTSS